MAGVKVGQRQRRLNVVIGECGASRSGLERCTAGKSGVHVVPPFDAVALAKLPAQQHDTTVPQRRKVDQTAAKIFELNTESLKLTYARRESHENCGICDALGDPAAALLGSLGGLLGWVLIGDQTPVSALNPLNDPPHCGEKRVCFFNAENLHGAFNAKPRGHLFNGRRSRGCTPRIVRSARPLHQRLIQEQHALPSGIQPFHSLAVTRPALA